MDATAQREALCATGASLHARGYAHATAGNISLKLDDGSFLITPTDACLGSLAPERLAHVGADGVQLAGDKASKTLALHRRIYAADPAARCVLHTHARQLVALTLRGVWRPEDIVPPITPYFVMKVGHVPLVPYHRPGHPAVAEWVAAEIGRRQAAGTPIRGVMLDRLGPVVWQRSPAEASAVLEELEETAALWLASGAAVAPLTDSQLQDLRDSFGAVW